MVVAGIELLDQFELGGRVRAGLVNVIQTASGPVWMVEADADYGSACKAAMSAETRPLVLNGQLLAILGHLARVFGIKIRWRWVSDAEPALEISGLGVQARVGLAAFWDRIGEPCDVSVVWKGEPGGVDDS